MPGADWERSDLRDDMVAGVLLIGVVVLVLLGAVVALRARFGAAALGQACGATRRAGLLGSPAVSAAAPERLRECVYADEEDRVVRWSRSVGPAHSQFG